MKYVVKDAIRNVVAYEGDSEDEAISLISQLQYPYSCVEVYSDSGGLKGKIHAVISYRYEEVL